MSNKDIKKDPLLAIDESPEPSKDNVGSTIEAKPPEVQNTPVVELRKIELPTGKDVIAETKEILSKKPKINFMLPLTDGEKPGAVEIVTINGYQLWVQKGVMVEIPEPVAKILAEKYRIAMTLGQDKLIDRNQDVRDSLS